MIVALVFIFVAFVGPWYSFEFMGLKAEAGLTTGAVEGASIGGPLIQQCIYL